MFVEKKKFDISGSEFHLVCMVNRVLEVYEGERILVRSFKLEEVKTRPDGFSATEVNVKTSNAVYRFTIYSERSGLIGWVFNGGTFEDHEGVERSFKNWSDLHRLHPSLGRIEVVGVELREGVWRYGSSCIHMATIESRPEPKHDSGLRVLLGVHD